MEMGEAAPCLVRSFSQPSSVSCGFKEGDPLRALTTSISFGRFMTEPLDWEKWSMFSHNRTLEDVQKYSKPGSVAEKKAFFEAHYKKIAAKKAAKSPNKENEAPNYSPETNVTTNVSPITTSMDLDPTKPSTHAATDDTRGSVSPTPSTSLVFSHIEENLLSIGQVEQEIATTEDVSSPSTNLVFSNIGNVDDNIPRTSQVEQEITSTEDVSSENHQIQDEISNQFRHVDKDIQEQEQKTDIKDTARNRDKTSGRTKPGISSPKSSSKNVAYKLQSPPKAPTPPIHFRKAARDVMEKKRSAQQTLHMSMHFSPARKSNDMYSSLFANKNGNSKTVGKPKDRSTQQAQTRVSVNGLLKNSQVTPRPENKSHSESSGACTKKPRSTTVPSSFSFRSEERAAKRKEFFQKLEEKGNTKETEKIQPQPKLKEKASNDHKKLRRSTALEAKPSTSETKLPSNSIQKAPPTRPRSPKLGRKPTPRLVQDSCYQPPWRSSTKPKNFIEMNKKKLSSSMASLPTKKMRENSSPNIQP